MRLQSVFSLLTLVVLATGSLVAQSPEKVDLWSGTWKLSIAKSKYDPGPAPVAPTSTVITIEVVNGLMRHIVNGVDGQGKTNQTVTYVRFDGKDQPVLNTNLAAVQGTRLYKYADDHNYEWLAKVNGQATTTTKVSLAADRKSHTLTTTGKNAQGQTINNVAVWEKQ